MLPLAKEAKSKAKINAFSQAGEKSVDTYPFLIYSLRMLC